MNHLLVIISLSVFFLSSCNKNLDDGSSSFSKSIDLSIDPCDYISKQMIVCHFGLSSANLELTNDSNHASTFSQCGYSWGKTNHGEIQANQTYIMTAYASEGTNSNDDNIKELERSDLTHLELPSNHVIIGRFIKYNDYESAVIDFKTAHKSPSEEEFNKTPNTISEISDGLSHETDRRPIFTEVEGAGDLAFYDHKSKSLDVCYGTLSFSIFIETEFDIETNILIAKKLANEVWNKL
jgi:hypothetical protein